MPEIIFKKPDRLRTVHHTVFASCRRHRERIAMIQAGPGGIAYTYGELDAKIRQVAADLKRRGILKGERIGLLSENRPEWGLCYLAVMAVGATVVPLDTALKPTELVGLIRLAGIRTLFGSSRMLAGITGLLESAAIPVELINIGDYDILNTTDPDDQDAIEPDTIAPDDTAALIYTSGTTGDPKAVILTHHNLAANLDSILKSIKLHEDDCFLSLLPLHHTFEATCGFFMPLAAGLKIVYGRSYKSRDIIDDIRDHRVTAMIGVPLLFEKIYKAIRRKIDEAPLKKSLVIKGSFKACRLAWKMKRRPGIKLFRTLREKAGLGTMRLMVSGGAPLLPEIAEWFYLIGFDFLEGYGLTECAPVVSVNRPHDNVFGSVGPPLVGVEVRIENPGPDGIGEILVRGGNNTPGYLDNPRATHDLLVADGWLNTGDLGLMKGGRLYIKGRKKNLIITAAGKNVYPEEVEEAIHRSPCIQEAVVVGRQRENRMGEDITAILVPNLKHIYGNDFDDLTHVDMKKLKGLFDTEIKAINHHLADYKRITGFEISLDELKKTTTRKVKRVYYD